MLELRSLIESVIRVESAESEEEARGRRLLDIVGLERKAQNIIHEARLLDQRLPPAKFLLDSTHREVLDLLNSKQALCAQLDAKILSLALTDVPQQRRVVVFNGYQHPYYAKNLPPLGPKAIHKAMRLASDLVLA